MWGWRLGAGENEANLGNEESEWLRMKNRTMWESVIESGEGEL